MVHCCSIVPISLTVGANRIVPTIAIPHPFGDPDQNEAEEKNLRLQLVKKALKALQTTVAGQKVFE